KLEGYSLKHGLWTYYDPTNGKIEKTEKWWLDKPAAESENGELAPIDVSDNTVKAKSDTSSKKYPKPQAILDYEKKNTKKKNRVRDGQTVF
ncbi:MAG: hypothetical protein ABUT20_23390, partial [Bacteroidota bacterium]